MATLAPTAPAQAVYRPLSPGESLAARLEQMVMEGRQVNAQERYRRQRNREAYRGNTYLAPLSLARGTGTIHRLAPTDLLPSGRRRDSINRLRQMIDGRVSLMTRETPPHEVVPPSRERRDVDAARLAERIVDFEWERIDGWNVADFMRRLMLWAEQDGLAFGNVTYDRSKGQIVSLMVVKDPISGQERPAGLDPRTGQMRRGEVEALLEADPTGQRLWRNQAYPVGEVVLRTVRTGALAIDPRAVTDWRECDWVIESRVRKIVDLEREIGRPIKELIQASDKSTGRTTHRRTGAQAEVAEGYGEKAIDVQREVVVHELFHRATGPTGEFPQGGHVIWAQDAPAAPLVTEPWSWPDGKPRGLPYFPLIPRPDGGHILRTLGTVDELLPVQRQFDRHLSQYGEWLDLAARPPLVMVGGSLRSKAVFNADRIVHINPGFETPFFLQVPPDPGIALLQMLAFLESQMGEIAMQSGPVRGQPTPEHEAAAAINTLVIQGEAQIAGTEAEVKRVLQWTIREALLNVQHFYSIERTIELPGVDDEAEFQAFTGTKIRGAVNWRITGSVLPKNKAAQQAQLMQFLQYAGPRFDPTPFAAEILEADVETIISMERAQGRKQERENVELAALGSLPDRDRIWEVFTQMRDAYVQALTLLARQMSEFAKSTGSVPALDPQQAMNQLGAPRPPRIVDLLTAARHRVPRVAVTDRDHMHLRSLELWMTNDAFDSHHPLVQQAAREHLDEHNAQQARRVQAIALQSPQMAAAPGGAQPPSAPPSDAPPSEE